eukprot:COSAG02_NODE_793_length_17156_cov_54.511051_10_plen_220_part_00
MQLPAVAAAGEMNDAAAGGAPPPRSEVDEVQRSRQRVATLRRRIAACEAIIDSHLGQDVCTAAASPYAALDSHAATGTAAQWFQLTPTNGGRGSSGGSGAGDPVESPARLGFGEPPPEGERWYNLTISADRLAFADAASPSRIEEVAEDLREQKRKLVEKTVAITLSRSQLNAQLGSSRSAGVLRGWPVHDARAARRKADGEGGNGDGGPTYRSVSRQF